MFYEVVEFRIEWFEFNPFGGEKGLSLLIP